ncbi:hypothetical protein NA56DRAFT_652227 [Hyaloscypha hepaticicola]|uniref:Uncharacterized protein n=1 Tax=Hyaloscypha hepaticicola TaxID=2082293 RepID=A0A2J6PFH8_9HELO|nr:hypothetical protein NA56DRAFT_652227 [Hyaloscypha hepaticicola]
MDGWYEQERNEMGDIGRVSKATVALRGGPAIQSNANANANVQSHQPRTAAVHSVVSRPSNCAPGTPPRSLQHVNAKFEVLTPPPQSFEL